MIQSLTHYFVREWMNEWIGSPQLAWLEQEDTIKWLLKIFYTNWQFNLFHEHKKKSYPESIDKEALSF